MWSVASQCRSFPPNTHNSWSTSISTSTKKNVFPLWYRQLQQLKFLRANLALDNNSSSQGHRMRHCWYRQPPQRLHTKLGDFKSSKRWSFQPYHTISYHIFHFWYATASFKPRPSPIAWRSPILSWPRIMLYNRVCYDFFNRRHKCRYVYYSGFSHLVDKSSVLSHKYCVLNHK